MDAMTYIAYGLIMIVAGSVGLAGYIIYRKSKEEAQAKVRQDKPAE